MEPVIWSAPEYDDLERTPDWFWGLGLGAIFIAAVSIYFSNYLLAILILVGAVSLAIFAVRKPHDIEYEITDIGLRANNILYPFNTLESFWVDMVGHRPKIILASKKFFVPYIIIPIVDQDPKRVRDLLLNHLPEVEHHEPLIHTITERFGL